MAAGDRRYTRIPPESTGDRVHLNNLYVIPYANKTGNFKVGDRITLVTSLLSGEISDIIEETGTTGLLYVVLDAASEDLDVVNGENIQILSVTQAQVNGSGYVVYVNTVNVTGYNNPLNGMFVDNRGQAYVRFDEGAMQFDAFGRARLSRSEPLAEYIFNYDILPALFTSETVGSATITHSATQGALLLTNTTGATDSATYTSDLYHRYIPGQSTLVEMTLACGDAGKANLTRTWGYFDDDNGVFFRQTLNDFEVVVRSNVSGSPVETAVSQADFNGDVVDGQGLGDSNLSRVELDTSKDNLYWIDFQWLGSGRVRFGIFADGQRIVLHQFSFGNTASFSYMRSANLPIRFQQVNTSGTGSTSEMRAFCAAVTIEGAVIRHPLRLTLKPFSEFSVPDTETYLFSLRPKATFNSLDNRGVALPQDIQYSVVDSGDDLTDARIVVKVYANPVLTTPSWASVAATSIMEYDDSGSIGTPGIQVAEFYLKGTGVYDISKYQEYASIHRLNNKADLSQPIMTFTAQNLKASATANTMMSIGWNEVY